MLDRKEGGGAEEDDRPERGPGGVGLRRAAVQEAEAGVRGRPVPQLGLQRGEIPDRETRLCQAGDEADIRQQENSRDGEEEDGDGADRLQLSSQSVLEVTTKTKATITLFNFFTLLYVVKVI